MEKVSGSSPLTSTKITQSNDCVIFLSVNALNRYALTASEERSKRLHLRKSNAADIANNRT